MNKIFNNKMELSNLKQIVNAANGSEKADVIFTNCKYVNVFSEEVIEGDVIVKNGIIAATSNKGEYNNCDNIIDLNGQIIVPSFIDAHVHLESSTVKPSEFEKIVLPHGTQAVVCDPHEIANVCGLYGIDYILESTKNLNLDVYVNIPSCVPATPLDESGAVLNAKDIEKYFDNERVLGLAELMDYFATSAGEDRVLEKELLAINSNKVIDGHAPSLSDKNLNAYIASGVMNDHECTNIDEAKEKIKKGMSVFIREGTSCKDLEALHKLLVSPYSERCCIACDDLHANLIMKSGHIDRIVRKATSLGVEPIKCIKAATINPAIHFGLKKVGAIAPSYKANFFVCDNLESLNISKVYKNGILVAENGKSLIENVEEVDKKIIEKIYNSFHVKKLTADDLKFGSDETKQVVIEIIPGGILTKKKIVQCKGKIGNNSFGVDIDRDIVKVVNIERHKNTGHIGFGFLKGYGLKSGAIASSCAHDSHNIIVVGTNDCDMAIAANEIVDMHGGMVIVENGQVLTKLCCPIAGLMSDCSASDVGRDLNKIVSDARGLGVNDDIHPFMTLAFMALPVIPEVKIITNGLVDVVNNKIIDALIK